MTASDALDDTEAAGSVEAQRPPRDDVVVVPLRRRHLRGVLAIEQRVYPRPWSAALFASELARTQDRCYVVCLEAGGARRAAWWRSRPVLGYAGMLVQAGDAHITTVAVHPREHRRKIGTRLVVAVLRAAIEMGAQSATLEVRTSNLGAQRLYRSFGFTEAGIRPRYYAETGEDALVMWAHDIASPEFVRLLDVAQSRVVEPGGASGLPDLEVPWVRGRIGLSRQDDRGKAT